MAGSVMNGGTAYAVSAGRAMADGTAFDIGNGLCMDGGSVFEIAITPAQDDTQTVVISGNTSATYAYVTIKGTKISEAGEYAFQFGGSMEISVYVSASGVLTRGNCYVNRNGERVKSGYGTYSFTTDSPTVQIKFALGVASSKMYYYAEITD